MLLNMDFDMALHLCRIRAPIAFEFAVPVVTFLVLLKAQRVSGGIITFLAMEHRRTLRTTSTFLGYSHILKEKQIIR